MAFVSRLEPRNLAVALSTTSKIPEERTSSNQINAGMTRYDLRVCRQRRETKHLPKALEAVNEEMEKGDVEAQANRMSTTIMIISSKKAARR
jgi:hypothetical protein